MKTKWFRLLTILLIIPMIFVGCTGSGGDGKETEETSVQTESSTDTEEPKKEKIFVKIPDNSNVVVKISTKYNSDVASFISDFKKKTGLTLRQANAFATPTDFEIVIGNVASRPQSTEFYNEIGYSESAMTLKDKKLVIGTFCEDSIKGMLGVVIDKLVKKDGEWGIWSDFRYSSEIVEITENVPKFASSGTLIQGVESNGGFLTGYTKAKLSEVKTYFDELVAAGYTKHDENNVKNNVYATYVKNDTMVHVMWQGAVSTCKIAISSEGYVPETTAPSYTKLKDPTVAQVKLISTWGMLYVIQFEDGSFVVVDGGVNNSANKSTLLNYLKANKPAEHDKPHVTWIITHPHSDHIELPVSFLNGYSNEIYLDMISYNFPIVDKLTWSSTYTEQSTKDYAENKIIELEAVIAQKYKDTKVFIHHTGQKLRLAGGEIEFIFTQEDWWPNGCQTFNDTCSAFKITFDNGKSFLITADLDEEESDLLAKNYGDYLKCDVFQANHHGQKGGTANLYNLLKPTYVFWANSEEKCTRTSGDIYEAPIHHSNRNSFNPILFNDPNILGHFHGEKTTVINMRTMTATDANGNAATSFWPLN